MSRFKLGSSRAVAIDFETYLIGPDQVIPQPVCLSYADKQVNGLAVGKDEMSNLLLSLFLSNKKIIAHNLQFELKIIYEHFPQLRAQLLQKLEAGGFFCTKLYQQLIDNVSKQIYHNKSLANLVKGYFGKDISADKTDPDAWRLRYSELDGVPKKDWPKKAVSYAIEDSIWAYRLYEQQVQKKLKYSDQVYDEFILNLMAAKGILIDPERVNILERELLDYIEPRQQKLIDTGFAEIKKDGKITKKMKLLREYIESNYTQIEYTDKKVVSTTNESLSKYLLEKPDDIIQIFADMSKYEKALTAFVVRLKEACEHNPPLIRTEYNGIVSSGRTSARTTPAYPSVNIQQMPRELKGVTYDIRNCFIPRPGFKFFSIDYAGLELAATANQLYMTFGASRMRDTINSGDTPVDMHSKLAAEIMSMSLRKRIRYEDFVAHKKEEGYKEFRQLAKPINLGFPGGIGYDTMRTLLAKEGINPHYKEFYRCDNEQEILRLIVNYKNQNPNLRCKRVGHREWALVSDELVSFKAALFRLYPELKRFLNDTHQRFLTGEVKYMKDEYGDYNPEPMYRFNMHGVQRDWCTYTAFCNNYLMQSPSAVGAKKAMREMILKYKDDPDCNILGFIHDEAIGEIREGPRMYEILDDISQIMIREMQRTLRHVRITVEAELFDYWKKAGGFYDKTWWRDVGGQFKCA